MGVRVYYYVAAAVLVFGMLMPQHGPRRKSYIVLMAALHTFVCGWRYKYITGDLLKYAWSYEHVYADHGWFSEEVFSGGRNFLFFWVEKFFTQISGGEFQTLLIFIAIVIEIAVAIIIYRYSPAPWLSYFLWNCFGFYIFGFSAIKQALAMALLMFAFIGIMENRPKQFLIWTLLAGGVHVPALIFLPAYWIARSRLNTRKLLLYAVCAAAIFLFRNQIVQFISDFYYDETDYMVNDRVGGRFLMIVALLLAGLLLRGFSGRDFSRLFNLIVVAAILQMFSGFDNIFTRLADYYFQFLILYLPMVFYPEKDVNAFQSRRFALTGQQRTAALLCVVLLAGLYYYRTNLGHTITYAPDNYLDYRFCWEVSQ